MDAQLKAPVEKALLDCLNLDASESVLIITDNVTEEIGKAFYSVANGLCSYAHMVLMPEAEVNGQEPSPGIAKMMLQYDVVICATAKSMTHTDAKRNATKKGVRVATLPGITKDVFVRTMAADYIKVARRTDQIAALLESAKAARIKTRLGTDLHLPISGMSAISSTGLIREKGKGGNLPSGEAFLAPEEGKSFGTLVIDASIAGIGLVNEPVHIEIRDGFAERFSGGEQALLFEQQLKRFGKPGLNVAELGIGTNDKAIITGKILEDEKVFGTVHVAFGNNISMGGTCNVGIHVDAVLTEPDVWIDDQKIMEQGKLLIKDEGA